MPAERHIQEYTRTLRRRRRTVDDAPLEWSQRTAKPESLESPALAHTTAQDSRQDTLLALQESNGNQHVQRVVAQSAAASTVVPQLKETDYGTFLVYPDDHPLSLGLTQDPKREWPVTETIFDQLEKVIDMVGGSSKLELNGGSAFKAATLMDLGWIMEQSAGSDLLEALAEAGRKLTIEFAPGAGLAVAAENSASVRPDGTPGPGSDVLLRYTPELSNPSSGNQGWERRKPATALARLLIEALPRMLGTSPTTREREPVSENKQATGQDRLKDAIALENKLRGAFGMPVRPQE